MKWSGRKSSNGIVVSHKPSYYTQFYIFKPNNIGLYCSSKSKLYTNNNWNDAADFSFFFVIFKILSFTLSS